MLYYSISYAKKQEFYRIFFSSPSWHKNGRYHTFNATMPMANAQKHTVPSKRLTRLPTFHLSVKNKLPSKYNTMVETEICIPRIANVEKSTTSNSKSTNDHITLGKYKIVGAQSNGKMHASTTDTSNNAKITLMNGTKIQLSNNAHPDTYPN
jgi:hypothetical protein